MPCARTSSAKSPSQNEGCVAIPRRAIRRDALLVQLAVHLDPAPPAPLRQVHGRVGLADDVLGGVFGILAVGDADAGRHAHGRAADQERGTEGIGQPPGELRRIGRRLDFPRKHDELVPSESGDGVGGPDRLSQAPRDRQQQLVAGLMALRVVDVLEAVEVHEDDSHAVAG
jgi:hypothetical protein